MRRVIPRDVGGRGVEAEEVVGDCLNGQIRDVVQVDPADGHRRWTEHAWNDGMRVMGQM